MGCHPLKRRTYTSEKFSEVSSVKKRDEHSVIENGCSAITKDVTTRLFGSGVVIVYVIQGRVRRIQLGDPKCILFSGFSTHPTNDL